MTSAGIFISYRRQDSIATAGRLYDRLSQAFGKKNIFMDVDQIPPGVDFVAYIESELKKCGVLLALIGPAWLRLHDSSGAVRLFEPHDLVASEIGTALHLGVNVIPVLIDGALIPRADDLPEALKPLIRKNAVELRNTQFGADAERLVQRIAGLLNKRSRRTIHNYAAIGATSVFGALIASFVFSSHLVSRSAIKKIESVQDCGIMGVIEDGLQYSGVYAGVIVDGAQHGATVELKLVRSNHLVSGDYFRAGICGNIKGEIVGNRMDFSWSWADASGRGTAVQNGEGLSGTSGFNNAVQGAGTFILFLRKTDRKEPG